MSEKKPPLTARAQEISVAKEATEALIRTLTTEAPTGWVQFEFVDERFHCGLEVLANSLIDAMIEYVRSDQLAPGDLPRFEELHQAVLARQSQMHGGQPPLFEAP